ncbi:hypothetical protein MGYG_04144 [Nannizzia gypsea CBS 118893]|uniref:Wings apart-like protein C-terminal domain-containing protein n=1 Tax=Arthroderma gypseum (strain ATCC MYA-4604 / CBS 118893) TaxID=535722 RepID=E4UV23_ARTGP|nr:hypothetical protein MGYG_04144 [Nannizzia gypsea CBS 118893]EFR01140.1 hypothetical protein MGYG_04144 [Nannizzia gypsea CBS 118893]
MSAADNFTPSRKIRTYGKQARSVGSRFLERAPSDVNKAHGKANDSPLAKKGRSLETRKSDLQDVGSSTALPKATSPTTPRTPKEKKEIDIYDVQLSDEDRQSRTQPWLKRRKLSTPRVDLRSEEFDQVAPKNTLPRKPTTYGAASIRGSKDAASPALNGKKQPEVEVVIRSPTKPRQDFNTRVSKQKLERPPSRSTMQEGSSSTLLNGQSIAASSRDIPVRERRPSTPPKRVPRLTKSFSTGTDRLKNVYGRFGVGNEKGRDGPAKSITSTAERKRIVDALGRRQMADSSSDSSGDEGSARDRISRASSHSPIQSADHRSTADTMPLESAGNTRSGGQKQNTIHQAVTSGLKVTYSRQRSFLNEMETIEEIGGNLFDPGFPPQADSMASKISGSASQPPLGLATQTSALSACLEEESMSGPSTIRSIHELRRSGDNARYHAMIDTIFEDIEDTSASISRQRSGMVQLCTKLFDPQFSQRFLSNALEKRFAKINHKDSDLVCGYLTTCVYALLLTSGSTSPMTLHDCWTQILAVTPFLLNEDKSMIELAKRKDLKMTKAGKADIQDICGKMAESKIWTSQTPTTITPQVITLRCLELAVRKLRETGNSMETMPVSILHQVIHILTQHALVEDIQKAGPDELLILELTLSILESYTIHTLSLDEEQQEALKLLSKLGHLLSISGPQQDVRSRQVQILEIRLILNVTNNNPTLCEEFSTPKFIEALAHVVISNFQSVGDESAGPHKESLLDIVILALGALINLTEWGSAARRVLLESRVDYTTLIDRLIPLFTDGVEAIAEADSVVQTHSNVAFGYLSVLLCTACLDNEARSYLRSTLQARSFERLLGTVEEFLHYHRKVEDELHDAKGDGEDAMTGFTSRIQGIVDRIRDAERA